MESTTSLSFAWFSLTVPFFFLLWLLARHQSHHRSPHHRRRLPPGPKPLPIVGNLLDIGDKPHVSLTRLARTHGPVMSLQLGSTTTVVISSPDMAREVLQKNDATFSGRWVPDMVRPLRHHEASVVWLPAGEQWRSLRRACSTHLFNPQPLAKSQPLRRQKIRELISHVSEQSARELPVDIKGAAFNVMCSLICCTLFSGDLDSKYSPGEFKDVLEQLTEETARPNVSDFFPFLAAFDIQGRRRRGAALLGKIYDMIDEQIDHRLAAAKEMTEWKDFLGALLSSQVQEGHIDRLAVKSLIADLFGAATDTSSSTVEWAMAEMLRQPEAMAKARAELEAVIGWENEVEEADIGQLPYLQAVVKETLRLHPPTPFLIPHRAEKAAELGGYVVPEHARVLVNVWAIGRDEAVWPEAHRFAPERFLDLDVGFRGQDFELIPFGSGRRICPGLPLAFRTMHMMLAALIRRFEWRLPEGREVGDMDMTDRFGVTMTRAEPLRVVPLPITVEA